MNFPTLNSAIEEGERLHKEFVRLASSAAKTSGVVRKSSTSNVNASEQPPLKKVKKEMVTSQVKKDVPSLDPMENTRRKGNYVSFT